MNSESSREALCDLHLHTHYSDGHPEPATVVDRAVKLGLHAIAITDHDAVDGVEEAREAAREEDLEVVSGVELSTSAADNDLHLLAYFFDPDSPTLREHLGMFQAVRRERAALMVERLTDLGAPITLESVLGAAGRGAIGRPHVAQALVDGGHVRSWGEAFDKYLAYGKPAYVEKYRLDPVAAIRLVKEAGGVTVLAHPGVYDADDLIPQLAREGMGGLEVVHPKHSATSMEKYNRIAEENGLVATGGSDEHGPGGRILYMGSYGVPPPSLEELRERAGR